MEISKKLIITIVSLAVLGSLIWLFSRSLNPALGPVAGDIAEQIEEHEEAQDQGINNTDFPLELADGLEIRVFAQGIDQARFMAIDSDGVLYVSQTKEGRVVALPDKDLDGKADSQVEIISNIDRPHGLAFAYLSPEVAKIKADFRIAALPGPGLIPPPPDDSSVEVTTAVLQEYLYIAETGRVIRMEKTGSMKFGRPEVIVSNLPVGGQHFTRSIAIFGEKLYVSTGSSCNSCAESNEHRATIWEYDLDGSNGRLYARGLRNSVGLEFHPMSGRLWATENGQDLLGDDLPPDEINIIEEGPSTELRVNNYGWPECYGKNKQVDPDSDIRYIRAPCSEPFELPSYIDLPAHVAPLGMEFYQGKMFPELSGDLLVAYHGSWNRTIPVGYKIVRIDLEREAVRGISDFISGWLVEDNTAGIPTYSSLGRPVDIITGKSGEIYISDDKAGVIYLVTRN